MIAPQPALRAREAVGALAFAAPPVFRDRLMTMLRAEAGGTYVGTARPAAEALILLTNAGLSDETEVLPELFLADAGLTGISPVWLGGQLPEHAAAAERVAVAAREGSIMALEVAATAGLPGEDTELATRCADHALAAVERPSVTETRQPDGTITRSVGLGGGWEMTAVCARYAPVSVRQRLASRLVADEPILGSQRSLQHCAQPSQRHGQRSSGAHCTGRLARRRSVGLGPIARACR